MFRVSRFDAFVGHVSRGESAEKDGDAVLFRLTFCKEREKRKEALVIVFVLIQHPNILPLLLVLPRGVCVCSMLQFVCASLRASTMP